MLCALPFSICSSPGVDALHNLLVLLAWLGWVRLPEEGLSCSATFLPWQLCGGTCVFVEVQSFLLI